MNSSSPSPLLPRNKRSIRGQSRGRTLWKWLLAIILLALAGTAAYVGYLYEKIDTAIQRIASAGENAASTENRSATVLLLGKDTRKQTGSLNTDVIMVASLNPQTKSAAVVSIPRDTYIKLNGQRAGKANSYYAEFYLADKKTAEAKIKGLIGQYLGVPIDYIMTVDFKGFEEIVDRLGGLQIEVDMAMCYRDAADGTDIQLRKGLQTLNGKQTLDFVRYRQSNCGTAPSNDIERNERQQQVLSQIIKKTLSLGGAAKIGQLIETVGDHAQTDLPAAQIKSFIGTYIGIGHDKINYIHLQGSWESPYIHVKSEELQRAREALRKLLDG